MEKKFVYDYYTRRIVFEGTAQECWNWLVSQMFKKADGRRICRQWEENGDTIYDVGLLYIFNK